jgi:hypothetical protein
MVGAIPAAARVAAATHSVLGSWLALAACGLVPAVAAVALLRGAREGMRAFGGEDATLVVWAAATWAMATSLALAAFGAVLRALTHHHALAGVTFGLGGLVVAGGVALVVRRLANIARALDPWGRSALVVVTLVTLGAALGVFAFRVGPDVFGGEPAPDALVDGLAFGIATVALSRGSFAHVPGLARGGLPLALGVGVVGFALLARDAHLVQAIDEHATLFAPVAALVSAR